MYFIVLLLDTTLTILFRARAVRDQKPPSRQLVMLLIFNQTPGKSIPHIAEYGSAHSRKIPLKIPALGSRSGWIPKFHGEFLNWRYVCGKIFIKI